MTKREIIRVLDSNVRGLRAQLRAVKRQSEREHIRIRLDEAERIRDAIRCRERQDRRTEHLERLL